ncbi:hypothetical protein EV359DRAFT_64124 [Lentinula novae-zelandiae]|nr:hypothetical protein EV359DRAFT_64124 [Lentinula novae-zelandiae]
MPISFSSTIAVFARSAAARLCGSAEFDAAKNVPYTGKHFIPDNDQAINKYHVLLQTHRMKSFVPKHMSQVDDFFGVFQFNTQLISISKELNKSMLLRVLIGTPTENDANSQNGKRHDRVASNGKIEEKPEAESWAFEAESLRQMTGYPMGKLAFNPCIDKKDTNTLNEEACAAWKRSFLQNLLAHKWRYEKEMDLFRMLCEAVPGTSSGNDLCLATTIFSCTTTYDFRTDWETMFETSGILGVDCATLFFLVLSTPQIPKSSKDGKSELSIEKKVLDYFKIFRIPSHGITTGKGSAFIIAP